MAILSLKFQQTSVFSPGTLSEQYGSFSTPQEFVEI